MNIKNLFFGAFAVAALAACSTSDDLVNNQKQIWDENGNGYISFSLNLPKSIGTRANDNFNPGLASEYKVNDVALLFFKGKTESEAVYQSFVDLKDTEFGHPQGGNVSLDKKYVAKIKGMDLLNDENVYVLAVINRGKVFDHEHSQIAGEDMQGKTFGYLQNLILNTNVTANGAGEGKDAPLQTLSQADNAGILMLNAPLADKQGSTTTNVSGAKYTILQNVNGCIFDSESEARASDACAHIYVERAVAKVTVLPVALEGTAINEETSATLFNWELNEWWLDNTNTKSYVIRNMSNWDATYDRISHAAGSVYRMIGSASVKHGQTISMGEPDNEDRYRTYFAIDPNYDGNPEEGTHTFNKYNANSRSYFGNDNPVYCAENVFDVDHQVWGETTRVLVGVTLTYPEGGSLYAHPGDETFLTEASVKEMAFNVALDKYRNAILLYRNKGLLSGTIEWGDASVNISIAKGTNGRQNEDKVTVTLPTNNITVGSTITNEMVAAADIPGITTLAELVADLATINGYFKTQILTHKELGVRYYAGGHAYYQIRIKHFGDDLTPWNNGEYAGADNAPAPGGVTSAYPLNEKRIGNYLGRYGVLRNNWYEVQISDVIKVGYPTLDDLSLTPLEPGQEPPIDPNTPDDHIDKDQWINAEVNILSWAKRTQTNELGKD